MSDLFFIFSILKPRMTMVSAENIIIRKGFLLIILFSICFAGSGQVSTYYKFSASNQTFKADTSTLTVPSIFPDSWDDQTYTAYKFPFDFTYNGVIYTADISTIGVDTDGWIAFSTTNSIAMTGTIGGGSWISASNSQGVYLNGTANNNGFAGLNGDMKEQVFPTITADLTLGSNFIRNISSLAEIRVGMKITGTGIPANSVVNQIDTLRNSVQLSSVITAAGTAVVLTPRTGVYAFTRGLAPFRQFVIQWMRTVRFSGPDGDDFSFQLVLNEGGGDPNYQTLQAVYGTCFTSSATNHNVQVGLRGATVADFNARKSGTWATSTTSTTNRDTLVLGQNQNPISGLTYTWSPACLAIPGNPGTISGNTRLCPGYASYFSIPGVLGAIYYNWTYTGTGVTLSGASTLPLNTLTASINATGGILTVTAFNLCGNSLSSSTVEITIGILPSGSLSYPSSTVCKNGSTLSPTPNGAIAGGRYFANPGGLLIDSITGVVNPINSAAGSYTINYLFTDVCPGTATTTITIAPLPVVTVASNPNVVCTGGNAQLQTIAASGLNYTVTSIPYTITSNTTTPVVLWNTYQDDQTSLAINMPFTFSYYDSVVAQVFANTNGHIQLQTSTTTGTNIEQFLPNVSTPNNIIALAWDDLAVNPAVNPGALVRYFTEGVSPNRVMVFEYQRLIFLGGSSAQNITGQIRLYELDSHIEVAITSVNDNNTSRTKTLGIENSTGTLATTPAGRNAAIWNVNNEAWAFYPPVLNYSYSWSPATFLNSTTISNPLITGITQNIRYIVNVTNNVTGCSDTTSIFLSTSLPDAIGSMAGATSVCQGNTQTYSITTVPTATAYTWTYSGSGASFTSTTTTPTNSFVFATNATPGIITVTPSNTCGDGSSISIDISITNIVASSINYPTFICNASTIPVSASLNGVAGGTFSANPATGLTLNATTGIVTPNTSTTGTYFVSYAYTSNTCIATIKDTIRVDKGPVVAATATPFSICLGGSSQLQANAVVTGNYTVSSIPFSTVSSTGTPNVLWNVYTDDAASSAIAMPFTFSFYGSAVTQFYVHTNGRIELQTSSGLTGTTPQTLPNAANPNNLIAMCWDDLVVDPGTNTGSNIRYFVNGAAPNRVLVIEYTNLRFVAGTGAENVTGQARLYESDNHIEVALVSVNDNARNRSKTLGIENSNGTFSTTPAGRNFAAWNVSNEAWAFYPPTNNYTYAWTPTSTLNNSTITNPIAMGVNATTTYSVNVTNPVNGCSTVANATVSVAPGMSGLYTIGEGGNYTTLTAAVNDYNSRCIIGSITFSLISNTYTTGETFPITIQSNAYQSTLNTLTIKPAAGITPTITGSVSNGPLVRVLGSFIDIEGSNNGSISRNLTIINSNATTPRVLLFGSVGTAITRNNAIRNCILINGASTAPTLNISDATTIGNPGYFKNIVIQNDSINLGNYGIFINAATSVGNGSGFTMHANVLHSSGTSAIRDYGIYIRGIDSATISNNKIGNFVGTNNINDKGIWIGQSSKNIQIFGNTIYNLTAPVSYGAYGIQIASGIANNGINVFNNMISNVSGGGNNNNNATNRLSNPVGILLTGSQSGTQILFNNIHLYGGTMNNNNAVSACIRLDSSSATVKNNILVNKLGRLSTATNTGITSIGILTNLSNAQIPSINHNNYFVSPGTGSTGYIGQVATGVSATLAAWATSSAGELNGVNIDPVFVSNVDLHIDAASVTNLSLSNRGSVISSVSNDFDLQTRDGLTPDIGADEWNAPYTGSWVGRVSTDWLNSANWASGRIPDLNTDVTITGGYTFMPVISTAQPIKNLSLSAPNAANTPLLTLNAGEIIVHGTITRTGGSIDGTNGIFTLNGSESQFIPAGLFLNNLIKNLKIGNTETISGVTLSGTVEVMQDFSFTRPLDQIQRLNTGGFLVVRSTRTQTGSIGILSPSKFINGDVTVERYIPADAIIPGHHAKSWQHLAVPVNGQTLKQSWQEDATTPNANPSPGYGTQITGAILSATTPAIGFDVYTPVGGASVKTYNSSNNTWTFISNTTNTPSYNQKGYMVFVRGDRSVINFSGANSQARSTVLRSKGRLFTPSGTLPSITTIAPNKLESLGNPYASSIDFTLLLRDGPPSILNKFWIWDPTLNTSTNFGGWQLLSPTGTGDFTPVPGGTANYPAGVVNSRIQSGQAFFMMGGTSGGTVEFTEDAKVSGSANTFRQPISLVNRQSLAINMFNTNQQLADGVMVVWDRSFTNGIDVEDAIKILNPTENLGIHSFEKHLTLESRYEFQNRDSLQLSIKGLKNQTYSFRIAPKNFSSNHSFELYLVDRLTDICHPLSHISDSEYGFTVSSSQVLSANEFRFYIIAIKKKLKKTVLPIDPETKGNGLITKKALVEFNEPSISISPNPVRKGKLMFTIKNSEAGNHEIVVKDLMGNRVHSSLFESMNFSFQHSVQLTETLPTGVYILLIQNKNKIQKATFVVE